MRMRTLSYRSLGNSIGLAVLAFVCLVVAAPVLAQTSRINGIYGCDNPGGAGSCRPADIYTSDRSILIKGDNLVPFTTVSFGSAVLVVTMQGPGELVANLPTGLLPGPVDIVVSFPGGASSTFPASVRDARLLPTPTPGITPTPTPPGPSGTPTPIPTQGPPAPSIDKASCTAQDLEADPKSGLCLPKNPLTPTSDSLAASTSVGDLIRRVLRILLTLGGVVAVLFIMIGGYQYLTSRGNEDQAKAGRKTITYAVVGLVAVLLAFMLVTVLTNLFTQGKLFT